MMTIEIKVNGRLIGEATVTNRSSSYEPICDYEGTGFSEAYQPLKIPARTRAIRIIEHDRKEGAWVLVRRIAEEMTR